MWATGRIRIVQISKRYTNTMGHQSESELSSQQQVDNRFELFVKKGANRPLVSAVSSFYVFLCSILCRVLFLRVLLEKCQHQIYGFDAFGEFRIGYGKNVQQLFAVVRLFPIDDLRGDAVFF